MKRKILKLLCLLLLSAVIASPALAFGDGVFAEDELDGTFDSSIFRAGQSISYDGTVNGVAVMAGYSVNVAGSEEYIMGAGYNVSASGETQKDIFLAGYDLTINGLAGRDVFSAGNTLHMTGNVGRNLYAACRTAEITGTVHGDVYLAAETIRISDGAVITGDLHYNSDANAHIGSGVQIGGTVTRYRSTQQEDTQPAAKTTEFHLLGKIRSILGLLAIAFVLLWLTPIWETLDRKYTGASFGKYAAAFGIGCAVLFGVPVFSVVLIISQIGMRLGFLMLLLYAGVIMVSPVFAAYFIGGLLWRKLFKKKASNALELLIGIPVVQIVTWIPWLGFLVGFASLGFGIGAVVLLLGKKPALAKPAQLTVQEPLPPADGLNRTNDE